MRSSSRANCSVAVRAEAAEAAVAAVSAADAAAGQARIGVGGHVADEACPCDGVGAGAGAGAGENIMLAGGTAVPIE